MIIFGLGDRTLRASDLRGFGIYTGSNVSYNIEYLVKKGYIDRIKSHKDRRAVEVSLTKTGHIIRQIVEKRFVRAAQSSAAMEDLSMAVQSVEHLQRIAEDLHGMIRHIY
jgi:DNA-binding MarR family transcriptional regulator